MNSILKKAFSDGIERYYPYENEKLVISIHQSFVVYYFESDPYGIEMTPILLRPDNLQAFEFNGVLLPLALSLPYCQDKG